MSNKTKASHAANASDERQATLFIAVLLLVLVGIGVAVWQLGPIGAVLPMIAVTALIYVALVFMTAGN